MVKCKKQHQQQSIDDSVLCDLYNKLGTAYFKKRDFEKAYSSFEQGYRFSQKLPEFGLISARVAYNLGLTCNHLDYKDDARRYLIEANRFYETGSDLYKVADTLFALAMATGSVEYLIRARSIYEGLNLEKEANLAKLHFAYYVEAKRDYENAISIIVESKSVFARKNEKGLCVYSLARSAMICMENDDYTRARSFISEAEELKEKVSSEDDYQFADYYRAKAMYNLYVNNFDQCIMDSQKSSQMCATMGLYTESAKCMHITAEAYHQKGMNEVAYQISKNGFELVHTRGRKA